MNMIKKANMTTLLLTAMMVLTSLSTLSASGAQQKLPFEFIVAEVDKEVILYSELMDAVQQLRRQPGYSGLSPEKLQARVLQRLIDDKVILAKARKDTLTISDQEVDSRVNRHLSGLAQKQGVDMATLAKAIESQLGMDLAAYKAKLRGQVREQGTLQQVQMRYVGRIQPTRKEVKEFFAEYKDSLPPLYDVLHIAHIQKEVIANKELRDSVYQVAQTLIDSLDEGISFDSLARRHSQDASANAGGDIGFYRRGNLEPEYERTAFRLGLGKYADYPVKTNYGYHLIKKLAEKDDEVRSAHILLRVNPTEDDTAMVLSLLDSIKATAETADQQEDKFMALARMHSDDEETKINGGDLGWFERGELDTAYIATIAALQPGQISKPVKINDAWHLFYLIAQQDQRALTLEDNYAQVEQMAISIFSNRKLETFVKKWREEVYIDIRYNPEKK